MLPAQAMQARSEVKVKGERRAMRVAARTAHPKRKRSAGAVAMGAVEELIRRVTDV